MTAVYGKDITRTFWPEDENGNPIELPSQAPSIFLFEAQPSRADAVAGTGALSTCTYWAQSASAPYPCTYTLPAINDPLPDSLTPVKGYWESLKFVAQTSEEAQVVIRYFEMNRVQALATRPGTTIADLTAIYPAAAAYASNANLQAAIDTAEAEMRIEIEGKGIAWSGVADLSKTKLALAYKSLANLMLAQIAQTGDKHQTRYEEFRRMYSELMKSIELKFDSDRDGVVDSIQKTKPSYFVVFK